MALRKVLTDKEDTLRKKSRVVKNFDARLHILLDDMAETMRNANGAGLAAVQVGVLRRVVVVEAEVGTLVELINPEIIASEGEQNGSEGCLSVPGLYGLVSRPQKVTVKAQDRHGKEFTITGEDLTARAFCHEIDHLEGTLFTQFVTEYLDLETLTANEDESADGGSE